MHVEIDHGCATDANLRWRGGRRWRRYRKNKSHRLAVFGVMARRADRDERIIMVPDMTASVAATAPPTPASPLPSAGRHRGVAVG